MDLVLAADARIQRALCTRLPQRSTTAAALHRAEGGYRCGGAWIQVRPPTHLHIRSMKAARVATASLTVPTQLRPISCRSPTLTRTSVRFVHVPRHHHRNTTRPPRTRVMQAVKSVLMATG